MNSHKIAKKPGNARSGKSHTSQPKTELSEFKTHDQLKWLNKMIEESVSRLVGRQNDQIKRLDSSFRKHHILLPKDLDRAEQNLELFGKQLAQKFTSSLAELMDAAEFLRRVRVVDPLAQIEFVRSQSTKLVKSLQDLNALASDLHGLSSSELSGLEWQSFELQELCQSAVALSRRLPSSVEVTVFNSIEIQGNSNLLSLMIEMIFHSLVRTGPSQPVSIEVRALKVQPDIIVSITSSESRELFSLKERSLCEVILEAHGGKLWSKLAPSGQVTYYFTLCSWGASEET